MLDRDLRAACLAALELDPAACVAHARTMSWRRCAELLLANLEPWPPEVAAPGDVSLVRSRRQ